MSTTRSSPLIVVTAPAPELLRARPDPMSPLPIASVWPLISRRTLFVGLCLFIIAMGWDRAAWLLISSHGEAQFQWLEKYAGIPTLYAALKSLLARTATAPITEIIAGVAYAIVYHFGRLWIWIILATAIIFRSWVSPDTLRVRRALRTGMLLFLSPAMAGLSAEVLKLLTRRLRPEVNDGFYAFRAFEGSILDPKSNNMSQLSLASSHTSLAVAAALAGGLVFPRLRWLLLFLAAGTCLSRLLVGAHYLSDVVAGAMIGALAFRLVYLWDARNNHGLPFAPAPSHA